MEDLIWAFSPFLSRLLVFDLVEAAMPLVGVKLGFIPLFSATFAVKDIINFRSKFAQSCQFQKSWRIHDLHFKFQLIKLNVCTIISDSDYALIKLDICIIRSEEAGELESIMLEDKKSFFLTLARIWTANGGRELDLGYATKLHSFGPTAVAASTKLF